MVQGALPAIDVLDFITFVDEVLAERFAEQRIVVDEQQAAFDRGISQHGSSTAHRRNCAGSYPWGRDRQSHRSMSDNWFRRFRDRKTNENRRSRTCGSS